jgi:phenylacetate-CoA ligase
LSGIQGCLGYQVVIDRRPDGGDALRVVLDLESTSDTEVAAVRAGVAARLGALTEVPVEVDVVGELDPVTTTGAFVSWKAARILDNRVAPDSASIMARQVAHRYSATT